MSNTKLSKYFFSKEAVLVIIAFILIMIAGYINIKNEKPTLELSKQDTAINFDKNLLVFMSAGNKRLLTDLLWVQTLIESDLEHYAKKDLNNWLFLRFNAISILDPYFYENYLYGGQFLSIVKDDLEGADSLYEKGLKYFPDDYSLNYNAGFVNYYEIGNYKKGLTYLKKIVNHPRAPIYIRSIINKLLYETGLELENIFKLVMHNYENTSDETLRKKLRNDLYAIKAEIDLKCLNEKKGGCAKTDLDGINYQYKNGNYSSIKKIPLYRLKRREGMRPPSSL